MQVVLLKDVAKIGRKYEVKTVADGLARNLLLPKGLATPATAANLALANRQVAVISQVKAEAEREVLLAVQKLEAQPLVLVAKANEAGHLFAAIHSDDIAEALKGRGINLPATAIELAGPIKTLGQHKIHLGQADLVIEVRAEA